MRKNKIAQSDKSKPYVHLREFSLSTASVLFFAHIAASTWMFVKSDGGQVYFWYGCVFATLSLPYLGALLKGRFVAYSAIFLFFAGIVFNYTSILLLPESEIALIDPEIFQHVIYLLLVGIIFFMVGYALPVGGGIAKLLPIKNYIFPEEKLSSLCAKMYLTGYLLRGLSLLLKGHWLGGYQIVGIAIDGAIRAAIMLDLYNYFKEKKKSPGYFRKKKSFWRGIFFMLIEMAFGLKTGMKEVFMIPLIMGVVAYIKGRKRVPWAVVFGSAFFFLAILSPFVGAYRQHYWWGGESFSQSFAHGVEAVIESRSEKDFLEIETSAVERMADSASMAILCEEKVREGVVVTTFNSPLDYAARFVPRFLWPDKPSVNYNLIGRELGMIHEGDYSTSIGITLLAGFIMGGGLSTVMLGFFATGILLRMYWVWLMERSGDNILAFMIYFNILYTWIRDHDFFVTLHANASFLVYAYFLLGLVNRRRK